MADDQLSALPPKYAEHKTAASSSSSSSCFGCKAEHGVTKCRRGYLSVDMCRSNDGCAPSNDVKWCTSCIDSGNGFMCPVCKEYQCPNCEKRNKRLDRPAIDTSQIEDILSGRRAMIADDNDDRSDESSVPSDNSWHPEADLTLQKKKCQHCKETVCQLFKTSCYNLCDICGEASCKLCIKKHGEKWLQCEGCLEVHCNNEDGYTGRFFVLYCTNCKHKGSSCEVDDCEGKLDYYEGDAF